MFSIFAFLEPVHRAAVLAEYYLAHVCFGLWSDAIYLAGKANQLCCVHLLSCFVVFSLVAASADANPAACSLNTHCDTHSGRSGWCSKVGSRSRCCSAAAVDYTCSLEITRENAHVAAKPRCRHVGIGLMLRLRAAFMLITSLGIATLNSQELHRHRYRLALSVAGFKINNNLHWLLPEGLPEVQLKLDLLNTCLFSRPCPCAAGAAVLFQFGSYSCRQIHSFNTSEYFVVFAYV